MATPEEQNHDTEPASHKEDTEMKDASSNKPDEGGNENPEEEVEEQDVPEEDIQPADEALPDVPKYDPLLDESRLEPLLERRDRSLKEVLGAMDDYAPIIPDAVTDYYLQRAGLKTADHRIKRLLALATQKFISDIATDSYQYARIRSQSGSSAASTNTRRGQGYGNRTVLTMDVLSTVLADYGINANRPSFYR